MYREFIIFAGIVTVTLFMTIHSHNKKAMQDTQSQLSLQKESQENLLIEDGALIRLNSGVTITKRADLIIIKEGDHRLSNQKQLKKIINELRSHLSGVFFNFLNNQKNY